MSNTRRFNQRAQALRAQNARLSHANRRIRAPAHGLLGDSYTQRQSAKAARTPTVSLRQSQQNLIRRKGTAAELQRVVLEMPHTNEDSASASRRSPPPNLYSQFNTPQFDTPDVSVGNDADSDWSSESEDEEDTVQAQREIRVEYCNFRTRRSRTDTSNIFWEEQIDSLVDAYMDWCLRQKSGESNVPPNEPSMWLSVIDIFGTEYHAVPSSHDDHWQSASLVRSGIIPIAPLKHTAGVTVRTINLYHKLFVRCPRLGVQPFAKALCDIEGIAFKPYLSTQLYAALDVYVSILNGVRKRTRGCLNRLGREWRMMNTCPSCQYRLKEDANLPVRMIVTMDGNDSLKRVERKEDVLQEKEENGVELPPKSKERIDRRVAGEQYLLSRAETQAWDESNWGDVSVRSDMLHSDSPSSYIWAESHCDEQRWHNMQEKNTTKSSAKFCENGWFVLLCRHMLFLLGCDMVKSGERSQYPLSILNAFMSAEKAQRLSIGEPAPDGQLAVVYDIACKTSKTVERSPLKGLAQWSRFLPVVGAMHGYAHERACQLLFLMLYVVGVGLEDGEGCERYFNVSNALAAVTRYQSAYHRRQSISEFIYYKDIETYSNISKFIYGNYKQSLAIIRTRNAVRTSMHTAGISSPDVFYQWLVEEGTYLHNLTREPPQETLEMEYYSKLVALQRCQERLQQARQVWLTYIPDEHVQQPEKGNRGGKGKGKAKVKSAKDKAAEIEVAHRHEQENERKLIADVQALEEKLSITKRWLPGDKEWETAKKKVKEAHYRRALDKLEGLLLARMFEMSRLNISGTGYKMRKMIANSLKTRSKSVQAAITAYNEAATALRPPRRTISWDEVVEFSFLSEFDILRDTREDIREQQWATPANHILMHQFFKLIQAEEELNRLHVEIQRLLTFMRDDERYLCGKADEVESENPALALQIRLYWQEKARFNDLHRRRLQTIKRLPGFETANCRYFLPGTHVADEDVTMDSVENEAGEWEEGEDGDEEEEEEAISHRVHTALDLTID